MQNWVKKLAKVMAGVLAVVLFAGLFAVLSDVGSVTARADDASFVPSVDKRVESNGDGTYHTATSAWYTVNASGVGVDALFGSEVNLIA